MKTTAWITNTTKLLAILQDYNTRPISMTNSFRTFDVISMPQISHEAFLPRVEIRFQTHDQCSTETGMVGSSAASTFYWSLIHSRDSDAKRTLGNKLNLLDTSTSHIVSKNSRRLFYDNGNDGLSDNVRCLLYNMSNDNFPILQNILYAGF